MTSLNHGRTWPDKHLGNIWQAVRSFLDLLRTHLADEPAADALIGQVMGTLKEEKLRAMDQKLDEPPKPHQTDHPIMYSHYFTKTIQKIKEKR